MNFTTLYLTVGAPGAGKTTWAKKFLNEHRAMHYVSTDDIREELTGTRECDPKDLERIHQEAFNRVKKILEDPNSYKNGVGPSIIVDSTNTDAKIWEKYRSLNPGLMIAEVFLVAPNDCYERQKNRERSVPKEVIEMKFNELLKNEDLLHKYFNCVDYLPASLLFSIPEKNQKWCPNLPTHLQ